MHKVNEIQRKLQEIAPGTFQKLGDAYLKKKGYNCINSLGSVVGSDKVRTGTPDSLIPLESGSYVLAEYTTIDQKKLLGKIEDDLSKCFDESKTGIPLEKIDEVVFCHTGQLRSGDYEDLIEQCKDKGVNLNLFGIDEIAYDLFEKYKGLSRDFLDVVIDTGQILPPEEFISAYGKNQLTTPLSTSFQYRDEEIDDLVQKIENFNLTIITGKAGVGKTRLALEGCKRFSNKHSGYKVICIYNRFQQDLADEIRVLLSEPGDFLILVDDANRISRFEYFIPYLQDQKEEKRIKVIATVRDYAVSQITNIAQEYGFHGHLKIEPFSNEQIKGLVKKEFDINNPSYLERIEDVAQGNPRLALMAGKMADKHQTLESIRDVSNLYKEYYKSIDNDLNRLKDTDLLKVAGIVSFYRAVDRTNEEQMDTIKNVFKIDSSSFWEAVMDLHSMEMLDMYETEIVRISDQVLGMYLFYKAVFQDQLIKFSTLLNNFFPDYRQRFIDALNPVINAFDDKKVIEAMQPDIEKAYNLAKESNDEQRLMHLMENFWFIKPVEVLTILEKKIKDTPKASIDVSEVSFEPSELSRNPSILKILGQFEGSELDNFRLAVQLTLTYVEKRPDQIPQVIKLFIDKIGFHRYSWQYNYKHQEIVINELWIKARKGNDILFSKLFLKVADHYLKTRFRDYRPSDGKTITFIDFELSPNEKLLELRAQIWDRVFELYKKNALQIDAFSILQQYSSSGYLVSNKKIVQEDATYIIEFIESQLLPDVLSHCLFVRDYSDFLKEKGITIPDFFKQFFESQTYKIANLLLTNRFERIDSDKSYSEQEEERKKELEKYIANFGLGDFKKLFDQCRTVVASINQNNKKFQLKRSLATIFHILAQNDKDLCLKVIAYYLSLGDPFNLNTRSISIAFLECCDVSKALNLVKEEHSGKKENWLFGILCSAQKENLNKSHLALLYKLYENANRDLIPTHMDYLLSYQHLDSIVVPKVLQILLKRMRDDSNFIYIYTIIFNSHTDINQSLIELFEDHWNILKRAYFAAMDKKNHFDYDSTTLKKITNHDSHFIFEYIDEKFNRVDHFSPYDEEAYFSFIWLRKDFMEMMDKISKHVFKWEKEKPAVSRTYFNNFFNLREGDEDLDTIKGRQDDFLTHEIQGSHDNNEYMQFIFSVICNFSVERRRSFIALFLQLNNNFEDFKFLPLEPSQWGWTGSAVPMYQKRIEFLSSLLPLLNNVEFLKHRHLVKRKIEGLRKTKKAEQKRDFLREY